jgi:hypothetical protein
VPKETESGRNPGVGIDHVLYGGMALHRAHAGNSSLNDRVAPSSGGLTFYNFVSVI